MVNCSIPNCKNRSHPPTEGVTFHRLPKNEPLRTAWLAAIPRDTWNPQGVVHVCSAHFLENDLDRTSLRVVRLRENVVPSVFSSASSRRRQVTKGACSNGTSTINSVQLSRPTDKDIDTVTAPRRPAVSIDKSAPVAFASPIKAKIYETPTTSKVLVDKATSTDTLIIQPEYNLLDTTQPTPPAPNTSFHDKMIVDLKAKVRQQSKTIKSLRKQKARLTKRNEDLKDSVRSQEKAAMETQAEEERLKNESTASCDSLLKAIKDINNGTTKLYTEQLRDFSLSLYFQSPKAYRFTRQAFNNCLPHLKTLHRWQQTENGIPGLAVVPNAFEELQENDIWRQVMLIPCEDENETAVQIISETLQ